MAGSRQSPPMNSPISALGDRAFLSLNSRLEPNQLAAGVVAVSENGRMDRGSWQPRRAIESISGSLQVEGDPLRLPFFLVDTVGGVSIASAERVTELVTVEITGHGFGIGLSGYLGISGLTGTVDPNGVWFVTIVDADTLTFSITGATGSVTYAGTGKAMSVIDDNSAAEIFGSCLFSDPSSLSAESVIIAATGEAYKVDVATGVSVTIGYPSGGVLSTTTELIQAFDRVYLFRDGLRPWEWLAGASDFTDVQSGVYTQPQVFEVTGGDVDVVSGLCTLTVVGNTTIAAGDSVTLYGTDHASFLPYVGRDFFATAATTTTISFYIPVEDMATAGAFVLSVGKPISVGAGFQHMPAPPWGVYHQRRMIVPFRYAISGDNTTPVFTDRDVRDELAISDILDPETFDMISNQFRITAGIADFIVAVQPFYEDAALVFNRNSIHGMFGLSGSLADVSVRELTREIGCLARKSIVQHGPEILFLSDDGVYGVGFIDQYNLRGIDVALSDAIQPVIDRINSDLAADSVGIYFSNRYFLAVPLDSVAGANDATGNNSILVYNFLNRGWESIDSVADSRWSILNFHIGRAGERNDLYAVNDIGGLHKLDSLDYDFDDLALSPGGATEQLRVASQLETRQFDGETLDRKRFVEVHAQIEASGQSCDAAFGFVVEDSDAESVIGSVAASLGDSLGAGEGVSLRIRTGGQRGQGAAVTVSPSIGRPKVKSLAVMAATTNNSTTNLI